MYCPHCSEYIVHIGDFDSGSSSYASQSDSFSSDEDSMYEEQIGPFERSPLKRTRCETNLAPLVNPRPQKRARPADDSDVMDVDDDMTILYDQLNKMQID